MYKNLYTFLCESSSVDDTDKKLSAFKFFEDFNLPPDADETQVKNGILLQYNFDLISGWVVDDPSSRQLKLTVIKKIKNPDGEEVAKSETPLELPPNVARFNIRETIVGVPIKGFGSYTFEVTLLQDGKRVGKSEYPYAVVTAPIES